MIEENPELAEQQTPSTPVKQQSEADSQVTKQTTASSANSNQDNQKSSEAQKVQPQLDKKEFKGLQNQGGTCYMNSLLQALFMTPEFRRMIFRWRYDPLLNADRKDCILYQLQKLFANLLLSKQPFISTTGLTNSFQWDYKESFQQQDVQEFMRVLFDAIEQSFEINNTYGVIEDIYSGEGSDFIKCLECGYRSDRATKFYDLQLPVKNEFENISNDSIEKAIFGYLKPETLEGTNAYQCSGCKKLAKAQKGSRLVKLPAVLTLQLNRFTLDVNTWQRKKLNDKVSFPVVLNMNHFLDENRQQDFNLTEDLIRQNPLLKVKSFNNSKVLEAKKQQEQSLKIVSQTQNNFEEFLSNEIGNFDDTGAQKVQGTLAQKRAAERAAKAAEHKRNLQNLKKATGGKFKSSIDKSKLNTNFFNNSKTKKDEVSGWAHDFENPDAGKLPVDADEQIKLAIELSLKDANNSLSKSSEAVDQSSQVLLIQRNISDETKSLNTSPVIFQQVAQDLESEKQQEIQTKDELIQKINFENSQLVEKYKLEGPFVYELFACLIHQGGALGGHYYAYIKDQQSQADKWYNFNDYRVTECDLVDLAEMFGGNKGKGVSQTTNAYMLMYRLCSTVNQQPDEEFEIPEEILHEVNKQEDPSKQSYSGQSDREIKSQRMQLKIVKHSFGQELTHDLPQIVVQVDRREDTYRTLFQEATAKFKISSEDSLTYRLRAYNVHNNIMMETYTGQEDYSLESLKIYPMKTLLLEQRSADEPFKDYDPTQMVLKINIYREGLSSLAEDVLKPVHISVFKDLPMSEFLQLLSSRFNIKNPIVMKRNPMLNQRQLELLPPDKSLSKLRVNEGVNLFVEEAVTENQSISQWEKEFELDQNRLQVKYNKLSPSNQNEPVYSEFVIVDRRKTVLELKATIAHELAVSVDRLVFRRGGTHGAELVEDDQTLKQTQFYNMICIQVSLGTPTIVGQKRIKLFLAQDIEIEEQRDLIVRDYLYFDLKGLEEIPLRTAQTVADTKRQIIERLGPVQGSTFEINLSNLDKVILREKQGDDKLTQVLHDDKLLHSYQIFDGKELALQLLEDIPPLNFRSSSFLFMVRLWSPSNWTLSPLVQVFVPKMATLDDMGIILGQRFSIEPNRVQVCKIASSWNFSRIQLPFEQWLSIAGNSQFIASAPLYVSTDGLLIIVKDSAEKERQLTDEEQIKYNTAQFEQDQFSADKGGFKVTGSKSQVVKEQGVKITVKKQQTEQLSND